MTGSTTLAHLSDVHLTPVRGFTPRYWSVKRTLGYVNWHYRRKWNHTRSALDRLVADVKAQNADHVAVTGDLINLGLPSEYAGAERWLDGLGPPDWISVVPGNHDIYVRLRRDPGVDRWRRYMESDAWGAGLIPGAPPDFPYVRRVGSVALVGLNSAVPTSPGDDSGHLGAAQLATAAALLMRLGAERLFRCVLVHHPPLPGQAKRRRGLRDADQLRDVLDRQGAELVLHGHDHRSTLVWLRRFDMRCPVIGVPSGSMAHAQRHEALARYNLLRIVDEGGAWTVELVGRGLAASEGPVVELERRVLVRAGVPAP